MPASTQYLNGYLAELESAGLYAVPECMGISLSWRMPASTQYLNGNLAELENAGLYALPEWLSL
jgi:hypothetical protein